MNNITEFMNNRQMNEFFHFNIVFLRKKLEPITLLAGGIEYENRTTIF